MLIPIPFHFSQCIGERRISNGTITFGVIIPDSILLDGADSIQLQSEIWKTRIRSGVRTDSKTDKKPGSVFPADQRKCE